MEALFLCRDKVAAFYKNFEFLFKMAAKFVFALLTLNYLTGAIGYYDVLNIFSIRLFIAVVCAFVPVPFVVLIMGLVAVLHLIKMSMVLGALAAVVFVIVYFLYLRFAPSQGIFMLAVAVLSPFQMHYAVAFILGMFYSPVTLIPVGLAIVLIRLVECIKDVAPSVGTSLDMEVILAGYQSVIDGMMSDKSMLLMIAALAIIIVLTYVISQMPFDYSWYVAIAVSAVVNIVVIIMGNGILDADVSVGGAVIGTVAGALIAAFCQFMRCVVDYSKKEYVQFEDDEYYYYVKAVPKIGAVSAYAEEDAFSEPEEMNDKRAASKKKAAKKAQKQAKKALKTTMPVSNETPQDTAGYAPQGLVNYEPQEPVDYTPQNDMPMYDENGFDNYDFYDDDQSKF